MKGGMAVAGITCSADECEFRLARRYVAALNSVGLAAVILPSPEAGGDMPESYLAGLDGLVLAGGADVWPGYWGEAPGVALGAVDRRRDEWEMQLFRRFVAADKPVLGICRGMQLMNVAVGGSLWQDLVERQGFSHMQTAPVGEAWHEVELCGRFCEWLGEEKIAVNSRHHQGVRNPGEGISVGGRSGDGLPEGIYMSGRRFVVGVQWHPEHMAYESGGFRMLRAFAAACGVMKEKQGVDKR